MSSFSRFLLLLIRKSIEMKLLNKVNKVYFFFNRLRCCKWSFMIMVKMMGKSINQHSFDNLWSDLVYCDCLKRLSLRNINLVEEVFEWGGWIGSWNCDNYLVNWSTWLDYPPVEKKKQQFSFIYGRQIMQLKSSWHMFR